VRGERVAGWPGGTNGPALREVEWDGMGRFGTGMGRFWDEIGVLERGFWAKNEGLGRNGTIWDGFGHVRTVPFGIFYCKLFIYNYLCKSS